MTEILTETYLNYLSSTGADPGFSKGGGGEDHQRVPKANLSRGCPPEIFKNLVSKMAISSILRQILYSFNTNFG